MRPKAALPPLVEVQRPTPAECLRKAFDAYPGTLAKLPAGFAVMTEDAQAHVQLKLKAQDAVTYLSLLSTARRCAPEN